MSNLRIKVCRGALGSFLYSIIIRGVYVRPSTQEELREILEVEKEIRKNFSPENLRTHPVIRAYRDFYWRIGIDPTKTRPSAEALVRRVLRGKGLPKINNIVDAGNLASLKTFIPIGIYDLDRIKGGLKLRLSREGEIFKPIGGKEERLSEGVIVLADEEKILHLFPHRDSRETMIIGSTRNILVIACGVPGVPYGLVRKAVRETRDYVIKFAGGEAGEILSSIQE